MDNEVKPNVKNEISSAAMDYEVKPDVKIDILSAATVNSTPDVFGLNEIKHEFSLSNPHLYGGFEEHAVVKYEDSSIQSLNLQIKSEVPDLKCGIISGNDDIYIKLEPLVSEELHVKDEVEESLVDQTMEKPRQIKHFYCSLCSSTFKLNAHLQQHLKTHIYRKPFQCNVCEYKCIRKIGLEEHMRTHTGEKPFKCNICDYKCIRKSQLQRHIRAHTVKNSFSV